MWIKTTFSSLTDKGQCQTEKCGKILSWRLGQEIGLGNKLTYNIYMYVTGRKIATDTVANAINIFS